MKKKGKSYKAMEPYKRSKPVEQHTEAPKGFKVLKIVFLVLIWIIGCASVVLLIMRFYHMFNEHKH